MTLKIRALWGLQDRAEGKGLAGRLGDISATLGTHMVEGKIRLPKLSSGSTQIPWKLCKGIHVNGNAHANIFTQTHMYTDTHTH